MLASMLRQLGLHIGDHRDKNEEGIFFLELNEWMIRRAGGAWDNPKIFKEVSQNDGFSDLISNHLRLHVQSRRFAKFMDLRRTNISGMAWGWKDPRTIFTLKVWLKVFPNARILYIRRNGVDVAHSLNVRAKSDISSDRFSMFEPYKLLSRIKRIRRKFETFSMQSVRCLDLRNAFDLWCEYIDEAEFAFSEFQGEKLLVRYEDFLENPRHFLSKIAGFAGFLFDPKDLDGICASIDSTKAYGYRSSPALLEFYEAVKNSPQMRKLGY